MGRFDEDEHEDTTDREVSAALTVGGRATSTPAFDPRSLKEFIGQPRVREQLQLVLEGARTAAARRTTSCCPGRRVLARRHWP